MTVAATKARCAECKAPVHRYEQGGWVIQHALTCSASPRKTIQAAVAKPKPRPGEAAEQALYAMLDGAGYVDARRFTRPECNVAASFYVRQWPFGAYLTPPRRFQFDAAFPAYMLGIDVDGGAHAAGRAKVKSDTERRGLAAANGWKVLCLTPEQVRDGSAINLVQAALSAAGSDA